ncbi:hypothetical protein [Phenylobacterium sp.]|uniref:hypothetical protein n=1 Tax=Phenylobacterium sp. TaxID=1871053 RepID=UPI0025F4488C|nr:hypothetical protein [Phenylobacterium sp.]
MKPARVLIVAALAALAAGPALAQRPPADPIDALLRPLPKDADVEEPDTAATGSKVDPDPDLPTAPQPYQRYAPPPHPTLTAPVFINETGKAPDGPATPVEEAYDSRLRASAASVQGFQGPMEGGWTLSAGGRPIYAFQLVDKNGVVDGAWRDLRRPGAFDASGFFEIVERTGGDLTFRLSDEVVAVLHPHSGAWTGEITEAGRREPVTLARRAP